MKRNSKKNEIDNKNNFWPVFIQFIKFGIIGVSNTLIGLAFYYLFLWIDPNLYQLGNLIGWIISVANSFFWNNRFVFKNAKGSFVSKLIKTYLAYGSTFLLSSILLYIEIDVFDFSPIVSPLINLIITIPLNFLINKLWTFK